MNKLLRVLLILMVGIVVFSSCKKKDPPMVENGFYFDYKRYTAARYGGCVAGGIVNYTWDVNLVNIPSGGSVNVNADYYTKDCLECTGLQVTNNPLTERYIAVSGQVWREGSTVAFDVECRPSHDLDGGRDIRLKGSYICDED